MISVSDILGVLDRIPIWKQIKTLPARVEALEKEVAELKAGSAEACPYCGARQWFLVDSTTDETFGILGGTRDTYTCKSCGKSKEILNQN